MSGAEFSFGVKAASFNVLFGDDISFLGRTSFSGAPRYIPVQYFYRRASSLTFSSFSSWVRLEKFMSGLSVHFLEFIFWRAFGSVRMNRIVSCFSHLFSSVAINW